MATRILGPKMNLVRASLPFSMSFLFDGLLNSPLLRISEYVRDAHSQGSVSAVADVSPFSEFILAARVALNRRVSGFVPVFSRALVCRRLGNSRAWARRLRAAEHRARRLGVVDRNAM